MSTTPSFPTLGQIHKALGNTKLRLMKEYRWTGEFMDAAVNEYIRFLELHVAHPDVTIVPGKVVDKVWHDHILHTREYTAFCEAAFGAYLHHEPLDLSQTNKAMDMAPTLKLYAERFGHIPPRAFWTDDVKAATVATPPKPVVKESYSSCCR
jgi:hypothetical protein